MSLETVHEFETRAFAGYFRPRGHYHGLVLTHDANEQPITRPGRCFLNLEHYTAAGRYGLFVPRDVCQHSHVAGPDWIEIVFSAAPGWPLRSRLRYSLRSDDTIDVEFRFQFDEDLQLFEAFIASYMPFGTVPPLIKSGGRWFRPYVDSTPRTQLFVARDEAAKAIPNDGRWEELYARGYAYAVSGDTFDIPVMVTTRGGGLLEPAIIQMVEAARCPSLSPNVFAPAHDFSLGGYNVQSGQEIVARTRLIYRTVVDVTEVEALYDSFRNAMGEGAAPVAGTGGPVA